MLKFGIFSRSFRDKVFFKMADGASEKIAQCGRPLPDFDDTFGFATTGALLVVEPLSTSLQALKTEVFRQVWGQENCAKTYIC